MALVKFLRIGWQDVVSRCGEVVTHLGRVLVSFIECVPPHKLRRRSTLPKWPKR